MHACYGRILVEGENYIMLLISFNIKKKNSQNVKKCLVRCKKYDVMSSSSNLGCKDLLHTRIGKLLPLLCGKYVELELPIYLICMSIKQM